MVSLCCPCAQAQAMLVYIPALQRHHVLIQWVIVKNVPAGNFTVGLYDLIIQWNLILVDHCNSDNNQVMCYESQLAGVILPCCMCRQCTWNILVKSVSNILLNWLFDNSCNMIFEMAAEIPTFASSWDLKVSIVMSVLSVKLGTLNKKQRTTCICMQVFHSKQNNLHFIAFPETDQATRKLARKGHCCPSPLTLTCNPS